MKHATKLSYQYFWPQFLTHKIQKHSVYLFRTTSTTTEASRKKVDSVKRTRSGSLLEHVRQSYDVVWNGGMFKLDNENDSVNFGELAVSPPPSGKKLFTEYLLNFWTFLDPSLSLCVVILCYFSIRPCKTRKCLLILTQLWVLNKKMSNCNYNH